MKLSLSANVRITYNTSKSLLSILLIMNNDQVKSMLNTIFASVRSNPDLSQCVDVALDSLDVDKVLEPGGFSSYIARSTTTAAIDSILEAIEHTEQDEPLIKEFCEAWSSKYPGWEMGINTIEELNDYHAKVEEMIPSALSLKCKEGIIAGIERGVQRKRRMLAASEFV